MKTNTEIGVAVIGGGMWGANHIRVWNSLGNLRAVCETSAERRAHFSSAMPKIDVVTEVDAILQRQDINAIIIATPAVSHARIASDAIEAGKDVLIEKPMAMTVKDAEHIQVRAANKDAILAVGHVLEYHPAVTKLRELVASGKLGEIRYIYSNRLNLGRVRTEENALWSFAPHDVALMLRIVGHLPQSVTCTGGAYLNKDVSDVTLMGLSFEGEVMAHIFVSWLHPFKVHRFVLVGSDQMADFDDTAPWSHKLRLFAHQVEMTEGQPPVARRADARAVPLEEREPLEIECRHFLDCVANRKAPLTDGESGIDVLRVLEAGQRSLLEGGTPTTPV